MKKMFFSIHMATFWTVAVALVVLPTSAQTQLRIGTINLSKTFDTYWKTKMSDAQIKERAADFDRARKGMVEDLNGLRQETQILKASSEDPANSAEKREKDKKKGQDKVVEMRRLEQQILDYDKQARTTLAEQTRRLQKSRLDEIKEVVSSQAKELGYDLILDVAEVPLPRTPAVLYTNGKADITDAVLAELNKDAPEDYQEKKTAEE